MVSLSQRTNAIQAFPRLDRAYPELSSQSLVSPGTVGGELPDAKLPSDQSIVNTTGPAYVVVAVPVVFST